MFWVWHLTAITCIIGISFIIGYSYGTKEKRIKN